MKSKLFILVVALMSILVIYGCATNPTGGGSTSSTTQYTLSITVTPEGWGTVEANPSEGSYTTGETVELTATGSSGHVFSSWEGDATGATSPKQIIMNANKNIIAHFRTVTGGTYTLAITVTPEGAGTVEVTPAGANYTDGTVVALTAEADTGYVFDHWSGSLEASSSKEAILMNGNKSITAVFAETWVYVGSAGFAGGQADAFSLYFYGGTPYVAYKDATYGTNKKITVMKYNAGLNTWEAVGNTCFSADPADGYISLCISGDGTPYVAFSIMWTENLVVMKYNGSSWVNVGNAGFSAGLYPSLFISSEGTPYIAYSDAANSYKATVMKYNAGLNTWEAVGNADFSAGEAFHTSLFIYNGTPYVAYKDAANSDKATAMKYNGSSWENVGNAGFSAGGTSNTSLFISGDGTPYVAFMDFANNYKATVMKYNGSSWGIVGNAGFSAGNTGYQNPIFISGDGTPYVAYTDSANGDKATVMKYNGSSWETVGNAGFSPTQASWVSLYIYNGTPYTAYGAGTYSGPATVMKYGP